MKASVNVPLEVNLTTDMLLSNSEYENFIYEKCTESINQTIHAYFKNAYANKGFLERSDERSFRYTVEHKIENAISGEIKALLNERKEEIVDAVVKDLVDRLNKSAKTKTEMAELLLTVLTTR